MRTACWQWITTVICAFPLALSANGLRLVSQDAFAAARGEAFVATADNPAAIYYNPAGITQLEGANVRFGPTLLYYDPTFTPPAGQANSGTTYHPDKNWALAGQFFFTHSLDTLPISAGLGIYAPYGGDISWPQDTGFRTVAIEGSLLHLRVNPVVAAEILPGLSIAGGVMIDYSRLSQEQGLRRDYQILNNYVQFKGNGLGLGYNVGLLWKMSDKLAVGATFRSSMSVDYHGETEILNQPTIYTPWTTDAQLTYDFPLTAACGISFRPTKKWNLEINVDYTDWSSFDTFTLYQDQRPPDGILQNIPITLKWNASWMYGVGITHFFDNGWQISGGYLFNQNSVPDAYYSPVVADLDRHFASLGTGYRGDGWGVDLTYQFGYGPEHVVSGSQAPSRPSQVFGGQNADGTYEWISHAVLLSFSLQF